MKIINFSGGRSSAYMTIKYYKPGDIVIFTDTGREHPKTYKFIHDFEAFENILVNKLQFEHEGNVGFRALLEKKNYKVIPNQRKRVCTAELKIRLSRRWVRKKIGFKKHQAAIGHQ